MDRCKGLPPAKAAVAYPCDETSLAAALEAAEAGLIEPVLVGPPGRIAELCKMADRGQITGGLVDGPLAMDNAISKTAAEVKHIRSEVAGDADILVVPDLEAGNMLAKQLTFMANADTAGVVLGARVPVVLTSRSDNVQTRLASCAVGLLVAHARRTGLPGGGDIKVPDSRGER